MIPETPFVPMTGGCHCGKIRFRMEIAPIITHCCHCRDCQKVSGAAFRINAMIETDRLTLLQGAPQVFQSPDRQKRVQCPDCGLSVWSHLAKLGDGIAFVGVGMLDEGERLPPEAHYFVRSKHPWIALPGDLPAFEELGRPGKPGAAERIGAVMAARATECIEERLNSSARCRG
jgi:hypothetical protein